MKRQNNIASAVSDFNKSSYWWVSLVPILESKLQVQLIDANDFKLSQWWTTGKIGAASVPCIHNGIPAMLKIQGHRPTTSEFEMITSFDKQNKSQIIRPPKVYAHLEWDEDLNVEAMVMEKVESKVIIDMASPQITSSELDNFFYAYTEYKHNCINKPWLVRPKILNYSQSYSQWMQAVRSKLDKDEFFDPHDEALAKQALIILEENISSSDLVFCHGHFSPRDLKVLNQQEIVLGSNLYWSWRQPFYDLVFGYHWLILSRENNPALSLESLIDFNDLLVGKIKTIAKESKVEDWQRWLNLAFLGRNLAALMVDRTLLNQDSNKSRQNRIIISFLRKNLKCLISQF